MRVKYAFTCIEVPGEIEVDGASTAILSSDGKRVVFMTKEEVVEDVPDANNIIEGDFTELDIASTGEGIDDN